MINGESKHEIDPNIIHMPKEECFPNSGGLGKTFYNQMKKNGTNLAQIDGLTGEEDTYAQLLQRSIRTALKMRSKGFTTEDYVTILSYNNLNVIVPFISSLFLGIKVTTIDPSLSVEDITKLLATLKSKVIFVDLKNVNVAEQCLKNSEVNTEIVVFGNSSNHTKFSEFLEESKEEETFEPVEVTNLMETAIILFSSGSTGLPKGACLHHYTFVCQAYQFLQDYGKMNILVFSSIYWISQASITTLSIMTGSCRIVVADFNKDIVWNLLSKYKVDLMLLTPFHAISWTKAEKPKEIDKVSLKLFYVSGSRVAKELMLKLKSMVPECYVMQAMGLTELSGRGLIMEAKLASTYDPEKLLTSVGKPGVGISYKIVDVNTGKTLGPNQPGELRLKSVFIMNGLFGLDTSSVYDSEGWFKTGDYMYYDEDHYFFHVHRMNELIQFRTYEVLPTAIEEVLLSHPYIQYAVVVGLPHFKDISHPAAAVVLKDSAINNVTPQEIENFVAERVNDKLTLRGGVKIIKKLPLTTSGKIRKKVIQNILMNDEI